MLDLVKGGSSWEEIVSLAKQIEAAGASILNTGIGWHEARVPTIATMVPRAAFTWVTARLKGEVSIPLVTSNRINMPDVAEEVLARGDADMVSMARPFLADPNWVKKAREGRESEINTCIACNQACLDHVFKNQKASCLVNPFACREADWISTPTKVEKRYAVVGGGPAGLAFAATAADRGHAVTLFEARDELGGQFLMARKVPGKGEFNETLRYFRKQLELGGVEVRLSTRAAVADLTTFDAVVLATGVTPRSIDLDGIDHPKVLSYVDVLDGGAVVGDSVAIIGAGGIGFDVAEFLTHGDEADDLDAFLREWGVDRSGTERGGLTEAVDRPPARAVFLCQRSEGKLGRKLGKTTGWIHRSTLRKRGTTFLAGCRYRKVDDRGLHVDVGGEVRLLEVDNVVICAGQISDRTLDRPLRDAGMTVHRIGGCEEAGELDAKRAIEQAVELALHIEDR
jgi:2,4-dienoyl-CoA reductase (NADPH2)